MVIGLPKLKAALPRDWVGALNRNAVGTSLAQEANRTNGAFREAEDEPEIQELFGIPNHRSSFPDENLNVIESAGSTTPIFSGDIATVSVAESGTSPVPPLRFGE